METFFDIVIGYILILWCIAMTGGLVIIGIGIKEIINDNKK